MTTLCDNVSVVRREQRRVRQKMRRLTGRSGLQLSRWLRARQTRPQHLSRLISTSAHPPPHLHYLVIIIIIIIVIVIIIIIIMQF